MTKSKLTKKALLCSILTILLSTTMLIGTTFAWFTDTASTSVNKIQAGTLDVVLEMKNPDYDADTQGSKEWIDAEGETLSFEKSADAPANEEILWEPGCTYELQPIRITNNGNLALKYKISISGILGDAKLNEAITWTINDNEINLTEEHLLANTSSDALTIKGHMKEDAGNEYQGLSIDGIAITVLATQDTVEYDSYDNQYDADAFYPTYPTGVTAEDFPENVETKTSTGNTTTAPATAAYVDDKGEVKYVADVTDAIAAGATTLYLKENESVRLDAPATTTNSTNRTSDLTSDLTIYANGADFQNGEVSMNMTSAGKAADVTVKIVDAKNVYVWGNSPNDGVTQTVILENCHNEGSSATDSSARMFYLTGTTGTVNVTLRNCSVTKAEAPVYMNCNGSVTVENCSFSECASAMKLSLKATFGKTVVTVSNTTFDRCGCTTEMAPNGPAYLTEDSSFIKIKTKSADGATLTLNNVAITNVVGSNSIVVDGEDSYSGKTTVTATNVTVDGNTWTYSN